MCQYFDDKNFLSIGGDDYYSYTCTKSDYLETSYYSGTENSFKRYLLESKANYSRLTTKLGIDDSSENDTVEIICDEYFKFNIIIEKISKL